MSKREVKSSVKDESLIEKRREQMIRGAVKLFKRRGSIVQRPAKSQKRRGSVSERFMNISAQKKMCSILSATAFITKYTTDFPPCLVRKGQWRV